MDLKEVEPRNRRVAKPPPEGRSTTFLRELEVVDAPMLSVNEEQHLGRSIRQALKRLEVMVRRHPVGHEHILATLDQVCHARRRVVQWHDLKESHAKDLRAAARATERARRFARKNPQLARTTFAAARQVLTRYPLGPEFLLEAAREIAENGRADSLRLALSVEKLERVIHRLLVRIERTRDRFILSNQRLVGAEVLRLQPFGVERSDLFQEGILGLSKAALRFEATRGLRFSTYATYWIRQAVYKSIVDKSRLIRLPQAVHDQLRKSKSESSPMTAGTEGVNLAMNVTQLLPSQSEDADDRTPSLNGYYKVEDPPELHTETVPAVVRAALNKLGERERFIVESRFGLGPAQKLTLEQIGSIFGLSRERVRQIERDTLDRLKRFSGLQEVYEDLQKATVGQLLSVH